MDEVVKHIKTASKGMRMAHMANHLTYIPESCIITMPRMYNACQRNIRGNTTRRWRVLPRATGRLAVERSQVVTVQEDVMEVRVAIESLQNRADDLQQQLNGVNIAIAELRKLSDAPARSLRPTSESLSKRAKNTMAQILRDEGPLHRKELQARLKQHEIEIEDMRLLASYLSVDKRFIPVNKGNGVWGLTQEASAGTEVSETEG